MPTLIRRPWRLTQARAWDQKALAVFTDLPEPGTLMPTNDDRIDKYAARVAETQQAIEQPAR